MDAVGWGKGWAYGQRRQQKPKKRGAGGAQTAIGATHCADTDNRPLCLWPLWPVVVHAYI